MSDTIYSGGQIMIRIDGSKIRLLREQKGLTQLYVATAVDVTTDTVSRWENKRYPSIKKDNGIKLAEALEVELDDILEREEQHGQDHREIPSDKSSVSKGINPTNIKVDSEKKSILFTKKNLFIFLCLVLACFLVYILHVYLRKEIASNTISISRTVPPHFIAGRPLPVFLHISNTPPKAISLILRENLPPGTVIHASIPEASNRSKKDHSIQWLKKVSEPTIFIYTLQSEKNFEGSLHFEGILKISQQNDSEISIVGDNSSTATFFHWADSNRDNRISDEEILVVYDLTNSNESTGIDMDLLEEIWLGEGYIWRPNDRKFTILE